MALHMEITFSCYIVPHEKSCLEEKAQTHLRKWNSDIHVRSCRYESHTSPCVLLLCEVEHE
jgi:hypothetical protein